MGKISIYRIIKSENGIFALESPLFESAGYSILSKRLKSGEFFESFFGFSPDKQEIWLYKAFPQGSDIYYFVSEGILIASFDPILVAKAILQAGISLEIDEMTKVSVLRFGAPSPKRTLYKNIQRVGPGVDLSISLRNWSIKINVNEIK